MAVRPCLAVRVDAGPRQGAGHFMRCCALAREWTLRGGRVVFITRVEDSLLRHLPQGAEVVAPHEASGSEQDAISASTAAISRNAGWLVVDGYDFGPDYIRILRDSDLRVLQFDDNAHLPTYEADVILNQNIHASSEMYEDRVSGSTLLLGTRYALLRPEFLRFSNARKRFSDRASIVLISMGGSDPKGATGAVISAVMQIDDLRVLALVGPLNPQASLLREIVSVSDRLEIAFDSDDIPSLMGRVDLAVTAAGATVYELAFMGVPFVTVSVADNQRLVERGLTEAGFPCLGEWGSALTGKLADAVQVLAGDPQRRARLGAMGRDLVDGLGAVRVVDVLHAGGLA